MSNSNRYKSNSEGSDRHLHVPVQAVSCGVQGKILGNVLTITPRGDEILAHPETISQRGGKREILQWMESTIIQNSNKKVKELAQQKKREASREEAPVASTSKPQASQPPQEGKKKKKKNWRKEYSPSYRIPRIQ
ncbi:hypothetical protein O181_123303 [Austropuccinia psidii MF-1]|uniref:Uncharacterized protein n=1 Tax=Austropuccinia psidii MF-1 TaxID=1389203 RepID=A0A9Q3KKW4_9BASI|nr:hypothetical protein [Austropuccinia psidii MF-1]